MACQVYQHLRKHFVLRLLPFLILFAGCNATRHVPEGKYLLQSNTLKIKSDQAITRRGELNDQLSSLIIQKPNTRFLGMPYKVWLYNGRYRHYSKDTGAVNFQLKSKTVERPVIYDSTLQRRSALNLKSFLFNKGYFYTQIYDTVIYKGKRASVNYRVSTGTQYLIGNTVLVTEDSSVRAIVTNAMADTRLKTGAAYSMSMAEEERSRIANLLRNNGYFRLTQENVRFEVDTVNKQFLRDPENPFESAINFLALQRSGKKPTLDVQIIIEKKGNEEVFRKYKIGKVRIFPDFEDQTDFRDTTLISKTINGVSFRYHDYYVRAGVLLSHIFMKAGDYYSQDNYDRTIVKLNELGLFQYVQLYISEDSTLPKDQSLRCTILLTPADRYDFGTNLEVSNGSIYVLGNNASVTFRNRNWLRGANQLAVSLSAGLESNYFADKSDNFFNKFTLISKNAGIYSSITFPKFIAPIKPEKLRRFNQPRTIFGLGYNLLERLDYFTMNNVVANYTYNWRQNQTNVWDLTPAFITVLNLPRVSDSFSRRLQTNEVLANSYRENFVEGENLTFTFSNINGRQASKGYSFLKASIEEAGGILTGLNAIRRVGFDYSQYVKFDLDARHYFRRPHSTVAMRLFTGIGIPYDKSSTLPYIKQYFVGGAYSIRGWRVRQLGPGSYFDTASAQSSNPIDRVGDIKFEANLEYRFDMIQLFSGAIHLNGALFADAGNIWLARPSPSYGGGELALDKFGADLAVSTGAGLRVDIGGLFILRFDAAFPIKRPVLKGENGWLVREASKLDKSIFNESWRKENLVLNIAIGYPF
jgi:outer membrane protein insertion porin family